MVDGAQWQESKPTSVSVAASKPLNPVPGRLAVGPATAPAAVHGELTAPA